MSIQAVQTNTGTSPQALSVRLGIGTHTVALAAVFGAIGAIGAGRTIDPDLWWHLKAGLYVAHHHFPATRDYFSFTARGASWHDFEWLSELLMFALQSKTGMWGLQLFFAGIELLTFGLVYATMVRLGANRMVSAFLTLLAFLSASSILGARPQVFTLLGLALFGHVLTRFVQTRNRLLLLIFPVLMVPWANLHGGFILGLGLLGIFCMGQWIDRRVGKGNLSGRDVLLIAVTTVASGLAALINPYGMGELVYPIGWLRPSVWSNDITEWVSTDFHQPTMMVFEALLLILITAAVVGRPKISWVQILAILAFTHLALGQVRNVAVWAVVITPVVAVYLTAALSRPSTAARRSAGDRPAAETASRRAINVFLLATVVILYGLLLPRELTANAQVQYERNEFPTRAVTYLSHHRAPRNVFAQYAWSGYLVWKADRYRDFIDGRANTLFGTQTLEDYLVIYGAGQDWQQIAKRDHVDTVLVPPSAPIASVLALDHTWVETFKDSHALIFERASQIPGR